VAAPGQRGQRSADDLTARPTISAMASTVNSSTHTDVLADDLALPYSAGTGPVTPTA
jgi:hypothetical protein